MIALTVVRRSRRRLLILSSWIGYSDKPGGRLVFYTDGVTEAMDPAGAQFGEDGWGSGPGARGVSSMEQAQELAASVAAFAGTTPQHDDITLIVVP